MRAGIVFLLLFVPSGASCILPVCFWACFWGSLLIYVSLCVCQSKKKEWKMEILMEVHKMILHFMIMIWHGVMSRAIGIEKARLDIRA